jgi:hypothetical protein
MKISRAYLLTGKPVKVEGTSLRVFQPTMLDIAELGEIKFGSLLGIWFIKRKDLIEKENDETWNLSDFEIMREYIIRSPDANKLFKESCLFFLHKNLEFLRVQGTIFIGELESGNELTEELFTKIKNVISVVTQHTEDTKRNAPSSKKAEEIQAKIEKGQQKIKEIRQEEGKEIFADQIAGFVAHSNKSFEEVFSMTLVQFRAALEKTVQIENYTTSVMLSPHMDKKHKSKNKHWLE